MGNKLALKKYIIIALSVLGFLIIPLFINFPINIKSGFNIVGTEVDWLNFLGNYINSIMGIVGFYFVAKYELKENHIQQEEYLKKEFENQLAIITKNQVKSNYYQLEFQILNQFYSLLIDIEKEYDQLNFDIATSNFNDQTLRGIKKFITKLDMLLTLYHKNVFVFNTTKLHFDITDLTALSTECISLKLMYTLKTISDEHYLLFLSKIFPTPHIPNNIIISSKNIIKDYIENNMTG